MNWPERFQPSGEILDASSRPVRLMDAFYLTCGDHTELCLVASRFGGGLVLLKRSNLASYPTLLQELQAVQTSTAGRLPMFCTQEFFVGHLTHMNPMGNLAGLNDPLQVSGTLEGRWTPVGLQDLHQGGHFTLGRLDVLLSAQLGATLTFTSLGDLPQRVSALTFPAHAQNDSLMRLYLMHPDPFGESIDNQDVLHLTLKHLIQDLQRDLPALHALKKLSWYGAPPTTLVGQLKRLLEDTAEDSLAGVLQVLDHHLPAVLGEHGRGVEKAWRQLSVYDGRVLQDRSIPPTSQTSPVVPQTLPVATPKNSPTASEVKPIPKPSNKWEDDFKASTPQKPNAEPEKPETSPPASRDWDQDF